MGVSGQHHAPAVFYPRGKNPRYPLDRRLSGSRGWKKNPLHLSGIEPPIVQPVVRHYTAWATAAPLYPFCSMFHCFCFFGHSLNGSETVRQQNPERRGAEPERPVLEENVYSQLKYQSRRNGENRNCEGIIYTKRCFHMFCYWLDILLAACRLLIHAILIT
jgi:hypothetical protein